MTAISNAAPWRVALLAAVAGILAGPLRASGEPDSGRIVLWGVSAAEESVAAARVRLEEIGEVVDLPPPPAGLPPEVVAARTEASTLVERAQALYYEARFDTAAQILEEHVLSHGPALAAGGDSEVLRGLVLWLGASLAKLDRGDEAVGWFVLAIGLGQTEIDRTIFPPEVTAAFDRARQVAEGTGATVTLSSQPVGARFEVDGAAVGSSLALPPGRHVVVARLVGFAPAAELVAIGAEPQNVALAMEPASPEEAARQIVALRDAGQLSPDDQAHRALFAAATGADLVATVGPGGDVQLFDATGAPASWPQSQPRSETPPTGAVEAGFVTATPTGGLAHDARRTATRPVWRRWWFWVSLVGGAAAMATGVGVGVYYGTQGHDTFTIVPARGDLEPR